MGYIVEIPDSDAIEVMNHKVKYVDLFTKTAIMKYNSSVIIDFETTGLAPRLDEVINYTVVLVENNLDSQQSTDNLDELSSYFR